MGTKKRSKLGLNLLVFFSLLWRTAYSESLNIKSAKEIDVQREMLDKQALKEKKNTKTLITGTDNGGLLEWFQDENKCSRKLVVFIGGSLTKTITNLYFEKNSSLLLIEIEDAYINPEKWKSEPGPKLDPMKKLYFNKNKLFRFVYGNGHLIKPTEKEFENMQKSMLEFKNLMLKALASKDQEFDIENFIKTPYNREN